MDGPIRRWPGASVRIGCGVRQLFRADSLTYEVWYYILACLFSMAIIGKRVGWIAAPSLAILTVLDVWFAILGCVWFGGFCVSVLHATKRLPRAPNIPLLLFPLMALTAALVVPDNLAGEARIIFELVFGGWVIYHMALKLQKQGTPRVPILLLSSRFSYTLYVIHFPIFLFLYGANESGGVIALIFTISIAALIGPSLERVRISERLKSIFRSPS